MNGFQKAIQIFPKALQETLSKVPTDIQQHTQEIRLRSGQAVTLGYRGREHPITQQGELCVCYQNVFVCADAWIRQTVDTLCEGSFYAHQEEWKNLFV